MSTNNLDSTECNGAASAATGAGLPPTAEPALAGLWLVRHAQPLIDAGVCYGATDMAADRAATRWSAETLAQLLPAGAWLVSSPLLRCAQLARALQQLRPDLRARSDGRLAEMDFGCWEGWRWSDIPKPALDQWTAQFSDWRFGGRESVRELMQRVAGVWRESRALPGPVVWVTHAGVIRAALLLSRGVVEIQRSEDWPQAAPGFGQYLRLP